MNARISKLISISTKCLFLFLFAQLLCLKTFATDSLSYSGRLVNNNGSPVPGPVTIRAELSYTNAPGTILCTEDIPNVALTKGVFHIKLDFDCTTAGMPLTQVLAQTPVGQSAAIRITDVRNLPEISKVYSFQALHSIPFSNLAEQVVQMGATPGQVLQWNGTKWAPAVVGSGNGSVTSVASGTGLTTGGAPITTTGTISIADGGVGTTQIADGSVTNIKITTVAASKITGTLTSAQILDGTLLNEDINAAAAIDYSKLNVPNLAIPYAKLNIANGDIPVAKINGLSTVLSALIEDVITSGVTTKAPSENAVFNALATKLDLAGGTMTGVTVMTGAATITGLPALPLVGSEATSRDYVDNQITAVTNSANGKVSKTGDTMSGDLSLDTKIRLKDSTTNYVELKAPATVTPYTLTLPGSKASAVGQVLTSDTSGVLSWTTPASSATPAGAAGGDLSGNYPNPTITGLAQSKITNLVTDLAAKQTTTLADGNILVGSGGNIATAVPVSGDATLANTGLLTLANTAVTAGIYKSVTVDAKGRVTNGTNPTTLAGYGITDTLVTSVTTTAPLTVSGAASIPIIGIPVATTTVDGYLAATDWTIFNNKQPAITSASTINTGSITTNLQGGVVVNPYAGAAGNTGEVRFKALTGLNYVALKSPDALAASVTYTLPIADGSSGQVLTTNSTGGMSWTTVATGGTTLVGDVGGTIGANTIGAGKVTQAKLSATGTTNATTYLRGDYLWSDLKTDVQALLLSSYTLGTNAVVGTGDSVVTAFGKLQKQITDLTTSTVGGDLSGILPNPTVVKIQTTPVTISSLTTKNVLKYNGSAWVNSMLAASDLSASGTPDATTYLAGDNSWKNFNGGVIAAPLTGLSATGITNATGTLAATDSITAAFNKLLFTQGDYVSKSADQTINGTLAINSLTGFIKVPTPQLTDDAVNKGYVDGFGLWQKGTNTADVVRSSGNVGIGTASPGYSLEITGNADTAALIKGSNAGYLGVGRTSSNYLNLGVSSSNVGIISYGLAGRPLGISSGGIEHIRLDGNGFVGIGTTTPANTLDIGNSGGIHITTGIPTSTTAALYNNGGVLTWNGSPVSSGGTVTGVTGTAPVTITGTTAPVVSMAAATTSVPGYLTAADWTTFNGKAPLASPTLTGVPAAPTATVSTNTTQLATTAFVVGQAATVAPLIDGTAAVGTSLLYARQDHVHPTDTTRAAKGANSDITSLTGLTTALSIAQGGTGLTSLTGLAALVPTGVTNGTIPLIMTAGTPGQLCTNGATGLDCSLAVPTSSQWDAVTGGINYAGGNVGIGTTAPVAALEVVNTTGSDRGVISTSYGTNGGSIFELRAARGTSSSPSALQWGDYLGFLMTAGHDGTAFSTQAFPTGIAFNTTENWSATSHGSSATILTTPNGTTTAVARVLIDQNGNVGIGTTTPTAKLEIQGQSRSIASGGAAQINGAASVDWNNGNTQSMSVACTTTTFSNMLDGGTYILAVSETGTTTCTFAQAGLTFYFSPANGARISGKRSVYSFQRIGADVYVSWIAGFQ